jgi:fatty-acid desaturase
MTLLKMLFRKIDLSATDPKRVFIFQCFANLGLVPMFLNASGKHWTVSALIYFCMVVLGGTITYHRLLTHRAFVPKKWFSYLGPLLGSMIGAGSTVAWVANHRHHHQSPDLPKDPHSPHFQAWYKVMWLSMFHRPRMRFAIDILRSPFHLKLHKYYWGLHLFYFSILFCIDPFSVIYAYLAPAAISWHAASSINLVNHYKWAGYRNFETKDHSSNNLITGYLVGGEGFHNNHHADPTNYNFGTRWFEFDCGAFIIKYFLAEKSS